MSGLTEAEREALRTSGSWPNVGRDIFAAVERIVASREAAARVENSAAQAALGRVRAVCNEWAAAGGVHRRNADLIRDAIDGRPRENSSAQAALGRVRALIEGHSNGWRVDAADIRDALDGPDEDQACTACDHGYPASACSSNCDCGAC